MLLQEGSASGDKPVAAQGPFGTLVSEGFRLTERGQVVVFTGRVARRAGGWAMRIIMRRTILGLATALLSSAAMAQGLDLSQGGPIEVTAVDGIEWRQQDQVVIARGEARATRGGVTVEADRLIARYRPRGGEAAAAAPRRAGRRLHRRRRDLAPGGGGQRRRHLGDRPRRGRPRRL